MNNNEMQVKITDEQYLELVGRIASLFHQAVSIENTIAVTDKEKFIHYYKGSEAAKIDLVGKPFPNGGNIPNALKTGDLQISIIPKEVYGVAFKSSTIPVKNYEGNIIGTINVALSLRNQYALQEVTENISSSAEQLTATTEEIASSAGNLSENVTHVLSQTQDIIKLIEQTNNILDFVNNVASNSRLLGLNAAIEAARAGEFGKGFAVVADEIRKMAENSAKSVNETKEILSTINNKVTDLLKKVGELSDVAQAQASATEEISASVQDLASTAQTVQKISNII